MNFEWPQWEGIVSVVGEYLNVRGPILTSENFNDVVDLLPSDFRGINVTGNADDSALNNESLRGLISALPIARHNDFIITSYPWAKRPEAGLFLNLILFKNGQRLALSFADDTVYYKVSRRTGMRYSAYTCGEVTIPAACDLNVLEKLLNLLE